MRTRPSPSMARRMALRLRILLGAVALPLLLWLGLPMISTAASGPAIQHRIDSKRSQIEANKSRERVLSSDIQAFTNRIDTLQGDITVLQQRQVRLQTDLDAKRLELERIQSELRAERLRLLRLKARLAEAKRALAARLVQLYKSDRADIVTVVLNAKGFQQLLESADFMHRISAQDGRILDRVRIAKAESVATARHLGVLETRAKAVAASIQQRRDQVVAVKGQLVQRQSRARLARSQKAAALDSTRTSRHHLEDDVAALQKQQARIAARIRAAAARSASAPATGPAGPVRQGSGGLIWPVNGPITSPFCESRAWESCHPGIDIGVPAGTPIRAAAAGKVVLMQSEAASGGYGNFTCIQHSGSLSTCYAHQSRFGTSLGAQVSQGQVIGYVGCTGRCFGDHLHFETRVNGSVVNPMNYL
jgi:murein DD-endopeptidase MepM/ murein hydrolase activator NlpD